MARLATIVATLAAQASAFAPHPDELNQQALQVAGAHKQQGESCIDVTIFMTTGKYGNEVSWFISSTPLLFGSISSMAYAKNPKNEVYAQQECLPAATEYTITMRDSYGDGWNGGEVRIYAGTYEKSDLERLESKGAVFIGSLKGGHEKPAETFTLPLPSDYTPPASPDALDVALQAKLEEWKLLGFSVSIYKEGAYSEPIARGYGRTHADLGQAAPVTGDTVQMIASMSKTVLGAAATKLIDAGAIQIDDDIKDVLPDDWTTGRDSGAYRNPKSPAKPVTWRHIMTHMSSMTRDVQDMSRSYGPKDALNGAKKGNHQCPITDLAGFYGDYMMDRGITTSVGQDDGEFDWYHEAREKGGPWEVADGPGEKYQYSNFATGYLALLIELAVAKSDKFDGSPTFPEFCQQEILRVLNMGNTAWFRKDLPDGVIEATPAVWKDAEGKHEDKGHYCFVDYASGQLHTSARDLASFGKAWLNYGDGFISKDTGKEAIGCASRNPDGSIPDDDDCKMGYLWFRNNNQKRDAGESVPLDPVRDLDWTDGIGHSGSEVGIQTNMIVLPKAGLVAVVLTNGKGHDIPERNFMHEIMGTLLESAPLTSNERGEVTWPDKTPPPMWDNPNGCCTTVRLAAGKDADKVEKQHPGVLGDYVLTHQHTEDNRKKYGVYEKAAPSAGARGTTLNLDPYYNDWRVRNTKPGLDLAKANDGSFYSWSGRGKDVCPEDADDWRVQMPDEGYSKNYDLTLEGVDCPRDA